MGTWRDNVTMTLRRAGAMTSLRPVVRRSNNTHDVTEVQRCQSQCSHVIQPCDPEKYHTVGLHAWQRQRFGRNVRIKLFSRVWNRFQWCSTDTSPNYLGLFYDCLPLFVSDVILRRFFTKPRLILACDKVYYSQDKQRFSVAFSSFRRTRILYKICIEQLIAFPNVYPKSIFSCRTLLNRFHLRPLQTHKLKWIYITYLNMYCYLPIQQCIQRNVIHPKSYTVN
jgi:hypothetical protein